MSARKTEKCRIYGPFAHGFVLRHLKPDVDRVQVSGSWYRRTGETSALDEPTFIPEKRRWLRAYGLI